MASVSPPRVAVEDLPEALEPIVRQMIPGAQNARIGSWSAAERGFSTETFLFDVVGVDASGSSTLGLVFRRPPEYAVLPDFDLRRQYLTMQRLATSPVPVPTMRWIDATSDALGTPYFVMDRVDGIVTVNDFPPYHEVGIYAETDDAGRAVMWNACVDTIAQIHQLDPAQYRLGFLTLSKFGSTPPQGLANFLRYALNWASGTAPLHPALTRALDWLDAHLYTPERIGLCWGDSRMSNVFYRPDYSVAAAVDWEIAYLGDQAMDLAWMFLTDWASSPFEGRAGLHGTPSREETIDRYERLTGYHVGNMRFSDITAALLLAVALIRLNNKLAIKGVDLGAICAQRVEMVLEGD
jgi:aminoglycoside phosphotransferase (APT) family kinase protein